MFKRRFPTLSFITLDDKWISLSLEMVFWTLVDVIIVNPIHVIMLQRTSTTTTHVTMMIA
jgi:hypothetical protein